MPGNPLKFNCGEYLPGAEPYSTPPISPTVPPVYIPRPITTTPPFNPPTGDRWACEQRVEYCPEYIDPETGIPAPRIIEFVERRCVPCYPGPDTGFVFISVVGAGDCPFITQAECESYNSAFWRLGDFPTVGTYECKNYSQPCPPPPDTNTPSVPPGGPGGPGTGGPGGPGTGGPGTGGPATGGPGGAVTPRGRFKCNVVDYPCVEDLGSDQPVGWIGDWPRIAYRVRTCEQCITPPDGIAWPQECLFESLAGCEAGVSYVNNVRQQVQACNNYETLSDCQPIQNGPITPGGGGTEIERRWKCYQTPIEYCPIPFETVVRSYHLECIECFRASNLDPWPDGCQTDPTCGGNCVGYYNVPGDPCQEANYNSGPRLPNEFRNSLL